ncbi:hypothetical protein CXF95_28380 [Paraglaciecola sp. MB-3u-78]|nr:hypothetical protein CXF95_28380 [Paraglaciecola sp. MB-3u-78]
MGVNLGYDTRMVKTTIGWFPPITFHKHKGVIFVRSNGHFFNTIVYIIGDDIRFGISTIDVIYLVDDPANIGNRPIFFNLLVDCTKMIKFLAIIIHSLSIQY